MSAAKTSRWSALSQPLILAAVYFVATKLAVALTEMNSNAAAVWLPAGIGFAALVLHGLRLWPAVAIGAFLGVITPATGWQAATLMMLANTLFAVAAVWLATQWLDFRAGMHRVRDVVVLFIPVALGVSLLSAALGSLALIAAGWTTWVDVPTRAILWWLGDAIGLVIMAPLLLAWRGAGERMSVRDLVLLLPCAISILTFALPAGHNWLHDLMVLAIFPIAVWCSLESSVRALALTNFFLAAVAVIGTTLGRGPFAGMPDVFGSIIQQGYVFSLALIMLVLGTARAQQRATEAELRTSEMRFRNLLKLSSDWYWEQGPDLRFADISTDMDEKAVIGRTSHIGKLRWELPAVNLDDEGWKQHRAMLDAHLPFRDFIIERVKDDGSPAFLSISGEPVFGEGGGFLGYRGIGRNVTSQRLSEQALRESELRFRSVWETTTDAALIVDESATIRFANPAVRTLVGYEPGELVGQPLSKIQPAGNTSLHLVSNMLDGEEGLRHPAWRPGEAVVLHRDGRQIAVEAVFSDMPLKSGHGFVGFLRNIQARKQVEEDLRSSRALFETIFASSPIPIVISRVSDGRFFEVNQASLDLFGFSREQVIGKTTLEMAVWPTADGRDLLLQRLRTEGRVVNYDIQLRAADGRLVDVLYSAQVAQFSGEACIIATIIDVTARKRAEELQREYEQRFAKVFHSSPDAIVISRLSDGVYLEVNDAWADLSGYSREEALGHSAFELDIWVNPADRVQLVQMLGSGEPVRQFDFQFRRKGGDVAQALLSAEIIELRGEPCLLALLADITERRLAVEKLRQSERRFADVVDAAGEYVWETDVDGRYLYVSARIEKVLGYTAEEMIGKTAYDFMTQEEVDRLERWFDTRPDPGTPIRNLEHMSITRDGRHIWQQVSGVPVFNDAGSRVGFRGTGLDITERKLAEQRIEELATRDALTQLPNRRLLTDRLSQGILAAQRSGGLIAVLFIDLDRFKTINDSLGHAAGDELLRTVAARLQQLMRKGDTLARIGGDEFVVVLEALRVAEDAGAVAHKIIATLSEPYVISGNTLTTSASIGISVFPGDAPDGSTLVRNADMAMYFAKEHGRRNYQFYSEEMNSRAVEKLTMENTLRQGIERGEFELFYHPKFSLSDSTLTGVEALVRWNHPELGRIGPGRFIPVLEETGLIVQLGEWVLNQACRQSSEWTHLFRRPVPIAVNLSVGQFNKSLARTVRNALSAAGLQAEALELEITESMLMTNVDENIDMLRRLSDLGVTIAIDDFGTGYSSLAYLRRFQVDTLKIDQSFVRDADTNLDDAAIIEAIVALGHSLKLNVVAEGVETLEQKRLLGELGCDQCQGFLFGEPVPAREFEQRYLRTH